LRAIADSVVHVAAAASPDEVVVPVALIVWLSYDAFVRLNQGLTILP